MDLATILSFLNNGFGRFILVILILAFTFFAAGVVKGLLNRSFVKSSKLLKVDPTHYALLKHVTTAAIYMLGIGFAIYVVPTLRTLSISLFAGAGILAVVVGFASQQAFSNIISGIFIAIFKPFRVEDRIKMGTDVIGIVEDITLMHTIIRNFENKRLIIPNSIISNQVIENSSLMDERICRFVDFGISYDSNIDKAIKIIQKEAVKHKDFLDNRSDEDKASDEPPVTVRVIGLGDSSVNLRAGVWAKNPAAAYRLGTDLNKSIKERFDKAGIEIPFPHRTIVYKTKKRTYNKSR